MSRGLKSEELKAADTKPCAYCGSLIPSDAKLCSVCKSYQSKWRNNFVYWAGLAGLIGLLGSAFAYIISEASSLRKFFAWNGEVKVAKFVAEDKNNFDVAASNVGDGSVILSSIVVEYRGGSMPYEIHKVLDANTSLSERIENKSDAQGNAPRIRDHVDYDLYLGTNSGKLNTTIMKNSDIIYSYDAASWPCLAMELRNEGSEEIPRMGEYYKARNMRLVTEPVKASVVYYSVHARKELRTPFPALALFVRSTKPACRAQNYND